MSDRIAQWERELAAEPSRLELYERLVREYERANRPVSESLCRQFLELMKRVGKERAIQHLGQSIVPMIGRLLHYPSHRQDFLELLCAFQAAAGPALDAVKALFDEWTDSENSIPREQRNSLSRVIDILGFCGQDSRDKVDALRVIAREDRYFSESALVALGRMGGVFPDLKDTVIEALEGHGFERKSRFWLAKILTRLADQDAAVRLFIVENKGYHDLDVCLVFARCMARLGEQHPEMFEALEDMLNDREPVIKLAALDLLAESGRSSEAALTRIHKLSETDRDKDVKRAALDTLDRLGLKLDKHDLESLVQGLESQNGMLKKQAIEHLTSFEGELERRRELLLTATHDPSPQVQVAAFKALSNICSRQPCVTEPLKRLLPAVDSLADYEAVVNGLWSAPGALEDEAVFNELVKHVEREDFRALSLRTLGQFKSFAPRVLKILEDYRESENSTERMAALDSMIRLGRAAAPNLEWLSARLESTQYHEQRRVFMAIRCMYEAAQSMLPRLLDMLEGEDQNLKIQAAEALEFIPLEDLKQLERIRPFLFDEDDSLRMQTAIAIERTVEALDADTSFLIPDLIRAYETYEALHYDCVSILLAIGVADERVYQVFKDLAQGQGDSCARERATAGLGLFKDKAEESLPLLIDAFESSDEERRWSALTAIKSLGEAGLPALPTLRRLLPTWADAKEGIEALEALEKAEGSGATEA